MSCRAVIAFAIAAVGVAGACGGSADRAVNSLVLRVSAGHDLGEFNLEKASGASAYALDLVYLPSDADGRLDTVLEAVEGGDGPFEHDVDASNDSTLVLRARGASSIDAIRIIQVAQNDEWRMLHGRAVDVIPTAPSMFREKFEQLDSVRIIDLPVSSVYSLYFNTRDPALAEVEVRRAIAQRINVDAIANVACATDRCAHSLWEVSVPTTDVEFPQRLSVMYVTTDAPSATAARVVRLQLLAAGIDASLVPVHVRDGARRIATGEYQLLVSPMPLEGLSKWFSLSFRYSGEAFDPAAAAGDEDRVRSSLGADAFAITLFDLQTFAAIDRGWCGGEPNSSTSWLWLADLYPCSDEP